MSEKTEPVAAEVLETGTQVTVKQFTPDEIIIEAKNELVKVAMPEDQLKALAAKSASIEVTDYNDTEGIKAADEARKDLKKYRNGIERKRKELKADFLKVGNAIDGEAKRLTALIEPEELRLENMLEAIKLQKETEERERREAERRAAEEARLKAERTEEREAWLSDLDFVYVPKQWYRGAKTKDQHNGLAILGSSIYLPKVLIEEADSEEWARIVDQINTSIEAQQAPQVVHIETVTEVEPVAESVKPTPFTAVDAWQRVPEGEAEIDFEAYVKRYDFFVSKGFEYAGDKVQHPATGANVSFLGLATLSKGEIKEIWDKHQATLSSLETVAAVEPTAANVWGIPKDTLSAPVEAATEPTGTDVTDVETETSDHKFFEVHKDGSVTFVPLPVPSDPYKAGYVTCKNAVAEFLVTNQTAKRPDLFQFLATL